ncbi:MAG: hypothetical protein L0J45_07840 [Psychroflexus sp.]|nr:hypothetical protein [Psychroflexus sp.]MDN6310092.1 hypothetical protein [Psychroflexus sp.]
MKKVILLFLVLTSLQLSAQKTLQLTEKFTVSGDINKALNFTLKDLEKLPSKKIEDVKITNHKGHPRGTAKQLTGVLVKDVLKDLDLKADSPKIFSEFYLSFIAIDGYKVIYSWNEIFNSPTGDHLYIITARDDKKLRSMNDRILVLTPSDFKTGRRHIKGLSEIVVSRAD